MTSVLQFSWTRMEGFGLIVISLGVALLIHLPIVFFGLVYLNFDLSNDFIGLIGTIIGVSIILTTLSCSLTEDWDETIIPSMKRILTTSIILNLIFISGFFVVFAVMPVFPPELSNLDPQQQYFSADAIGLILVGLVTFGLYKAKNIFR